MNAPLATLSFVSNFLGALQLARSVPSKLQQKKCTYARKFHFYCHMRHFFLNIQPKAVIILDFLRLSAIGREVLAVMGLDIKLV